MAYTTTNDTGKYQQAVASYYQNPSDLYDAASRSYVVTPAVAELPRYAKMLSVYVPAALTAGGTVTVVMLNDSDATTTVFTFGPGNWIIDGFVRRVTQTTATIIVTAMTD